MTELEREELSPDNGQQWIVRGPVGAITFWREQHSDGVEFFGPIGLHSRVAMHKRQKEPSHLLPCEYLDGDPCYYDSASIAGNQLGIDYTQAGRDVQIIWDGLEEWYQDRLAPLAEKVEQKTTPPFDLGSTMFRSIAEKADQIFLESARPSERELPQRPLVWTRPRITVTVMDVTSAAEAELVALGRGLDFFKSPRVRLAGAYSLTEKPNQPGVFWGDIVVERYDEDSDNPEEG